MSDARKFKREYETLNNDYNDSKTYKYLDINVSRKNNVKYSSYDEVFKILDKGTGVIYFGFPECPWCRNLVPVLVDAADEAGIANIYYLNNRNDRDVKKLENDKVITEKKGTENYYKLVKKLDSILGEYKNVDGSVKRLYYPTIVFVKDGKIVDSHIGTLDSHVDGRKPLTNNQEKELKEILVDKMNKVIICDGNC